MASAIAYAPQIFDVKNRDQAKGIILTPQEGLTPDQRWETETPHLVNLIMRHTDLGPDKRVLDYGVGIGRISRELIRRQSVDVVGVDTSWSMRCLSMDYVRHDRYIACSPDWLEVLTSGLIDFDLGLAIWTLQHCVEVKLDIQRIARALRRRHGQLFVVNQIRRCVPCNVEGRFQWVDDSVNIRECLLAVCKNVIAEGSLDPRVVGEKVSESSFWAVYGF